MALRIGRRDGEGIEIDGIEIWFRFAKGRRATIQINSQTRLRVRRLRRRVAQLKIGQTKSSARDTSPKIVVDKSRSTCK